MSLQTIVISIIALLSFSAHATTCENEMGSCEYYTCLSKEMSCSQKQYLENMGSLYCKKFSYYKLAMTARGQSFVSKLRYCLQSEIENSAPVLTCENARELSKPQHISCYIKNGFCNLGTWDKSIIFGVTAPAVLRDDLMKSTASAINQQCRQLKPKSRRVHRRREFKETR